MRWRRTFMAEVFESLIQLGLRACPVCGSAESLGMSPFPAILVDGEFPLDSDVLPEEEGDLTFAVRIECTTCGHLMLFNAQRYRTEDAKIIEDGITEEERPLPGAGPATVTRSGTWAYGRKDRVEFDPILGAKLDTRFDPRA
jgi:hypothetical protein